nr:zinc finger BED domain-containing protein 4-like [Misgurnus anguillicaudatus]
MIALDLQPFSIVEDRGFKTFTKALNPSYILPSRQTLSKTIIPEMFLKIHEQIMEKVNKASAVCLTTDCWTSRATCGFMSVTCHFIENYKMESCLLDCFEFTERHTADNLADNLLRIAREWNITDKIVACVSDNAHNISLAIHKTSWKHLPCFAHTVNLIVRGGLSVIQNTLNKIKAIVEYMHRSTVAAEKLKATQQQMGLPELKLKQDCPTRWNSTFDMLQRFLANKDAIITTLALVNARLETLTQDEWKELEEACEALRPFEEVTVEISGESYVTASKVILLSRSLQKICTRYLRSGGFRKPIIDMLETMTKDMATRFHKVEFHHLLSEASALDPRFKKRAFSDDHAANEAFQRLKNAAGRVRLSSSAHQTEQQQAAASAAASPPPPPQETQESLVWGDFDEQVAGLVTRTSSSAEAVLEMRSYSEEPLVARSSNPLLWWQN